MATATAPRLRRRRPRPGRGRTGERRTEGAEEGKTPKEPASPSKKAPRGEKGEQLSLARDRGRDHGNENTREGARRAGKKTLGKIEKLASETIRTVKRKDNPALDIPIRALSNVSFSEKKRLIELGDQKQ